MFSFIITEVIVLLIIVVLLLILSGVWPPDSPWAPWWQMPQDVIPAMCKLAKISSKDIVYDLGCGTGKALVYVGKTYGVKGIGIEIDPIRFLLALWNVRRFGVADRVTIMRENFFKVNLRPATVVFVYLVPAALKRLAPKFLKELQPGTKFISYIYPMQPEWFGRKLTLVAHDKRLKIYCYKFTS